MKVLIAGGGTAGHINPALAIAGYIKERENDAEILFIGSEGGMEERLVRQAGFELKTIRVSGFQRKISVENAVRNAKSVMRVITSSIEAKKIIKEFSPDVCVGTGGYVSGPVIRDAVKMNIPCVIHEQNAYPGITTKLLAKKVKTVMLAVADAKEYLDKNTEFVITGNPVRGEVLAAEREKSRTALGIDERPLILSFGGSLGARAINRAVEAMLAQSAKLKKYQHIHGFGQHDKDFEKRLSQNGVKLEENPQIIVCEYINNMSEWLSAADLVICRSGAITLTEIEAKAKASILIPSPNVAENHQYHNAMALVKRGAAEIIEEKDLDGRRLWSKVEELMDNPGRLAKIAENAGKLEIADANMRIYRAIKQAIHK